MGTTVLHRADDSCDPAAVRTFVDAVSAAVQSTCLWTMPVAVAVSGGADSMALLHALRRLAPSGREGRLVVAHVEHDLRAAAADDREFVAAAAARQGLPFDCRRVFVTEDDGHEGLEGRGRRLRYAALVEMAHQHGCRHVAVAHTADDQAETILHRLLRGTGVSGLAGMRPVRPLSPGVALVRPMLGIRRRDPRAFLKAIGESWREDPTNDDRSHARNLLRHEVLARCEVTTYPGCTAAIGRLGRQAAALGAALRSAAERLLDQHARRERDGSVTVRAAGLTGLDPHLVAEIFVALWRREGWPCRDMTAADYAKLSATITGGGAVAAFDLPAGIHVREAPGVGLRLAPPLRAAAD
ncbi:MAG: tRNA lysidine(34) synthetase TilS [Planctomycetaceae bacterium]